MTIIREMLLTSSYDFTHHTEKKVLTIDRKNCLPSSEKTAYRGQKKVLTADRKNSLPNDGKIILPRAHMIGWGRYCKYLSPATVMVILICMTGIYLRYF